MRKSNAGYLAPIMFTVAVVLVFIVVKVANHPAGTDAAGVGPKQEVREQAVPAVPAVSLVFVVDSSPNMFPRYGPNYFDFAKEVILDVLTLPGFPMRPDVNGQSVVVDPLWEVGVMQFTRMDASGYDEGTTSQRDRVQWFGPVAVADRDTWSDVVELVQNLAPSTHHTASLMDMGIREATAVLKASDAASKHMILLTSGEYRLPPPCPPSGYVTDGPYLPYALSDCDTLDSACFFRCSRACHVRYFADRAREADPGIRISTVHLGPNWRQATLVGSGCQEDLSPYGTPPTGGGSGNNALRDCYCEGTHCPGCSGASCPRQPSRGGFAVEIAKNWLDDGVGEVCPSEEFAGRHMRVRPPICFGCDEYSDEPRTSREVATGIAKWFADWGGQPDLDGDSVVDLFDNCPTLPNTDQRDCDRNGIGDVCLCNFVQCPPGALDSDGDGIFDVGSEGYEGDLCVGGDDCLVVQWREDAGCGLEVDDDGNPACECDCDHSGSSDYCEAALECVDDPANCGPEPSVCRAPSTLGVGYREDFDGFLEGTVDGQSGWVVRPEHAGPEAAGAGRIVSTGADKILEIGVDTARATNGTDQWYVESPVFKTPLGEPFHYHGCVEPYIEEWGVTIIELTLMITEPVDGPTYDIYILDSCTEDLESAKRMHLEFPADSSPFINSEFPEGCSLTSYDPGMNHTGEYPGAGAWFILRIAFLEQSRFVWNDAGFDWNGRRDIVSLERKDVGSPNNFFPLTVDGRLCELGDLLANESRGVRLRFVTDNRRSDESTALHKLAIGGVRVFASNRCNENDETESCGLEGESDLCICKQSGIYDLWTCESPE